MVDPQVTLSSLAEACWHTDMTWKMGNPHDDTFHLLGRFSKCSVWSIKNQHVQWFWCALTLKTRNWSSCSTSRNIVFHMFLILQEIGLVGCELQLPNHKNPTSVLKPMGDPTYMGHMGRGVSFANKSTSNNSTNHSNDTSTTHQLSPRLLLSFTIIILFSDPISVLVTYNKHSNG